MIESAKNEKLSCSFCTGNINASRITATEVIGGVKWQITLEQDASGHYREIKHTPIGRTYSNTK
ncbi:MAG: hypothetical protein JSV03_04030 [Planctomycetota bacterium]|nr:MAG: hypothetical protein JSV03_04030 [Planctomycetota bacterium]